MHCWCKFGKNVSNTGQGVMSTTFWDAHGRTHARTRQNHYAPGHTTLGEGIIKKKYIIKNQINLVKLYVSNNTMSTVYGTVKMKSAAQHPQNELLKETNR